MIVVHSKSPQRAFGELVPGQAFSHNTFAFMKLGAHPGDPLDSTLAVDFISGKTCRFEPEVMVEVHLNATVSLEP